MYPLIRKLLFRIQPEQAHRLTIHLVSAWPGAVRLTAGRFTPSPTLAQTVCGLHFPHPIGLAAGLDKNAEAVDGWFHCGFSFAEVGTVTPLPQPGNPQPRLFRLPVDEALINRMGFNNDGAGRMKKRLANRRRQGIVGVNLGKNKVTPNDAAANDYVTLIDHLGALADYLVINVSSPNTPGLRDLQSESALVPLVEQVLARRNELDRRPPVFVKLAPDLADEAIDPLANALVQAGVDGLIATNTTVSRVGLTSALASEPGGLSGRPLESRSTDFVKRLYRVTRGGVPIIGSGGVFTPLDAYRKIRAGARLVQVYTGFIYRGPGLVKELVEGLTDLLHRDGFAHLEDAVGVDALSDHSEARRSDIE